MLQIYVVGRFCNCNCTCECTS